MLAGPFSVLPMAEQQMVFIDQLLDGSRGISHDRLLDVSARYAEFIGWLYQDSGNLQAAMSWSNTALDKAEESGDTRFLSYLRMRKSNIASDMGKPGLAVEFANSALTNPTSLTPQLRAVALRQQAHGHAMTGDPDNCARALEQAYALAAEPGEDDAVDMAGYCTTGFIAMEAAHCWVELGKPAAALETLQRGLADWNSDSRRDLGVGLARLATAHAVLRQPDEALEVADHALAIVSDTRSSRTTRQLHRVTNKLVGVGHSSHARELDYKLRKTLRTASLPTTRRNQWT